MQPRQPRQHKQNKLIKAAWRAPAQIVGLHMQQSEEQERLQASTCSTTRTGCRPAQATSTGCRSAHAAQQVPGKAACLIGLDLGQRDRDDGAFGVVCQGLDEGGLASARWSAGWNEEIG